MKTKRFLLFLFILLLLSIFISSCSGKGKVECELNTDCKKAHFDGLCIAGTCDYEPIPDECGNKICEKTIGETSCSCETDCGSCTGPYENAKFLKKTCSETNECLIDVPSAMVKPVSSSKVLKAGGNTFKVITDYNQPFNFKKDTFDVRIILDIAGTDVSDLQISKIELIGTTEDRQEVVLARKLVNKYLRSVNSEIIERLILDLTTGDLEGKLKSIELQLSEDHLARGRSKTAILKNKFSGQKFEWVKPDVTYDCPDSCDDNNPGTEDICGPQTNNFCENKPIPNTCGNFVCDVSENQCSCALDCGLCSGSAGEYLEYLCSENSCKTKEKVSITYEPQSVFDDRNLNVFHLQNNYRYNSPFNVKTDNFEIEFSLYEQKESVSNIKIMEVRLLDGANELVSQKIGKPLGRIGTSIKVNLLLNDIGIPEAEKALSLTVYYEYTENEAVKKGSYTKVIGKEKFINPTIA